MSGVPSQYSRAFLTGPVGTTGTTGTARAEGAAGSAGTAGAAGSLGVGVVVVPSGSLPDQLRAALAPLVPALDAAERRTRP